MYLCIDLKCFYASVECIERGLDPLKTPLVVANEKRGKGALCLAISPYLKELGVKNRCRLFEIPNDISYLIALPRMSKYIEYSVLIYKIYLKYISPEDIYVYSIDEAFLDISKYNLLYNMEPIEIGKMIIKRIFDELNIIATCGVGSNLFLAKVALDIISKQSSDYVGVLNEKSFKEKLWEHQPLTDFWQIAKGTEKRLNKLGLYTLKDVAFTDSKILYKEFGINAENIINHANGIEPISLKEVKNYISKSKSISSGQILERDYTYKESIIVIKEMVELLVLELIRLRLVTNNISIRIGYSRKFDIPSTGGSRKIDLTTNSYKVLKEEVLKLYNDNLKKDVLVRKINISFNNLKDERFEYFNLFNDIEDLKKEKKVNQTIIKIKDRFGKDAILRGINLEESATTKKRNKLIGGHNAK